jgi:hypothetical protein
VFDRLPGLAVAAVVGRDLTQPVDGSAIEAR